jgi:hypothetical protein
VNDILGLVVTLPDACRACDSRDAIVSERRGPHRAALHCRECATHRGWLGVVTYDFLVEVVAKFGRPDQPIAIKRGNNPAGKGIGTISDHSFRSSSPNTAARMTDDRAPSAIADDTEAGSNSDEDENMSLGLRKSIVNILPRAKYDARIGQIYLEDRVQDTDGKWFPEQRNISREAFRAIVDLENVVIGHMDFPKGSRELMSTSIGFLNGLDRLHDLFEEGQLKHPDMLPVVTLVDALKVEMPNGTSFEPVFGIESWVERPPELPEEGIPLATMDKKPTNKHGGMDDALPF